MFIFVVVIHIISSLLLITIILMQSGRGGGLTDSFAGAESIFGTKTSSFMVRATSILAVIFLFTCIGLAVLSTQRSRSLIENELRVEQKQSNNPLKTGEAAKLGEQKTSQTGQGESSVKASEPVKKIETKETNQAAPTTQKNIVPEKSTNQTK